MTYQEFEQNLKKWAKDRNIDGPENSLTQVGVLDEEWGETRSAYRKGKTNELVLEIGDVFVTLQVLALQNGCRINYSAQAESAKRRLQTIEVTNENTLKQACHVTSCIGQMELMSYGFYPVLGKSGPRHLESQIREIIHNLIIFTYLAGVNPLTAMQQAWNKISKRKGKTMNGTFVKTADINR